MKNTISYKDYYGSVEFSDEDNVFFGKIIGINDRITYEGEDAKSLRRDFEDAVDEYIELCSQMGKEPEKSYKGTLRNKVLPNSQRPISIPLKSAGGIISTGQSATNMINISNSNDSIDFEKALEIFHAVVDNLNSFNLPNEDKKRLEDSVQEAISCAEAKTNDKVVKKSLRFVKDAMTKTTGSLAAKGVLYALLEM